MRQIIFVLTWILMMVFASTQPLVSQEYAAPTLKGEYQNCRFGYSVTIPNGFLGIPDSIPAQPVQNHGFRIQLSTTRDTFIGVDGSSNSAEWATVEEMGDALVETIRKREKDSIAVQKRSLKLNEYPAQRTTIRYQSSDSKKRMVYDNISILSPNQQKCYSLTLKCEEMNYEAYRRVFEELADTWRLYPCEESGLDNDHK